MLRNRKGQSTAEYAIIIGVIVAALIGMQTYIKRGLQARYHDGIQFLGAQTTDVEEGEGIPATVAAPFHQYEPYYLQSDYTTGRDRVSADAVQARGQTVRTLTNEDTTRAIGGFEQSGTTVGAD